MEIPETKVDDGLNERRLEVSFQFETARKTVTQFSDHFIVNAEIGFAVRKKLQVYTPKGYRGFVQVEGRLHDIYQLYTVAVGFYSPLNGVRACSFPIFQASNIEAAVKYAKQRSHQKNLKEMVKVL